MQGVRGDLSEADLNIHLNRVMATYLPIPGFSVSVGERYSFSARGQWKDGGEIGGAAGWQDGWFRLLLRFNRLPNLPYFLLCGVVGRNDRHAFPVGEESEWAVQGDRDGESDGRLYLFANDVPFMCFNNRALDESSGEPLRVCIPERGDFRAACVRDPMPNNAPAMSEFVGLDRLHGRVFWCGFRRLLSCQKRQPASSLPTPNRPEIFRYRSVLQEVR